ncbi:GntR family transcriptional regulator [Nocardia gipuzkoensis]|uniref:GntR family transcriptional regulator n=1 Tax=Nocardia gipuzkoensis TaxID=2749991 RepID=UPI0015EF38DD|nr:GntR family transcriptional regulator [Nocardia gipuzkoensis]
MSKQPGRPRYLLIADDLRERIGRGEYAPGDQIPTKANLMEQWNVALNTVDRAVDALRKEGLIETFQGVGTFVRSQSEPEPEEDELADLRERVARLETQMMDVYANMGLDYPTPAHGKPIEEAG